MVNTLNPRVLLVEDTPDIAVWLATALRQAGLEVSHAADGHAALQALEPGHGLDLVLLDLQLPGVDGLSVLQALRQRGDDVPVLVLTARASVPDRVLGLQMGADDYLTKPFDLAELEARIQALLRRPGRMRAPVLRMGALEMSSDSAAVLWQGQALALTPREVSALQALLMSPQRPVSKDNLHTHVFGHEAAELEAVEVLIHRLRKKLETLTGAGGVRIATFRGMGYMLTTGAAQDA
ncbi:MAG: Transcriptional regulatory protein tctD [Pseudomonadota bacterium]